MDKKAWILSCQENELLGYFGPGLNLAILEQMEIRSMCPSFPLHLSCMSHHLSPKESSVKGSPPKTPSHGPREPERFIPYTILGARIRIHVCLAAINFVLLTRPLCGLFYCLVGSKSSLEDLMKQQCLSASKK